MSKRNKNSKLQNILNEKEALISELQTLIQDFKGTAEERNKKLADLSDRIKNL